MSDKMQTIAYEKTMSDKNGRLFGRQVLTGIFVSLENRLKAILGQHVSSKLILAMKSSIIFMTFIKNGYIDVGDECLKRFMFVTNLRCW